jgi:hypothetical protein
LAQPRIATRFFNPQAIDAQRFRKTLASTADPGIFAATDRQ